jgi:hypothetical protein
MTPLERVLSQLTNLKPVGRGWLATCPVHDDQEPSLSVSEADDGKVLIKCFAGCPTEAVLDRLGLSFADLFPDDGRRSLSKSEAAPRGHLEDPIEWWAGRCAVPLEFVLGLPIVAEDGKVAFVFDGCAPRKLRSPGSKGRWDPAGVAVPPLWPVPTEAVGETAVLTAGESDATVGRYLLGSCVIAVTRGESAGVRDAAIALRGCGAKRIVIIFDCDEEGRRSAQKAKKEALAAGLSVAVLDLEVVGLVSAARGEKDLRDAWINAVQRGNGGDFRRKLHDAINAAEFVEPAGLQAAQAARDRPLTAAEILAAAESPEPDWLVDGLIPTGGVVLLVARPKVGKSTLGRAVAVAVAQGKPVLGREVRQGPVLLVSLEDREKDVGRHLAALGLRPDDPLFVATGLTSREGLAEWVREHRPVLVVVDTIGRLIRLRDSSEYAEVTAALEAVLRLARESGAAFLLLHHTPKGSDGRDAIDAPLGSTAFAGTADVILHMKRASDGVRTLTSVQRIGNDLEEVVLELLADGWPIVVGTRREIEVAKVEEALLGEVETRGEVTRQQLLEAVEGRAEAKLAALRKLVSEGSLLQQGSGRKGDPYRYRLAEGNPSRIPFPGTAGTAGTESEDLDNLLKFLDKFHSRESGTEFLPGTESVT